MSKIPDALFPSTKLGIPKLRPDLCADFIDAPVRGWGSVSRASRMRGTWHFYVDDFKFNKLWDDPNKALVSDSVCIVEINFTINDQMPYPVALYRIYQKRWIARYWQERGLRIFVDLNAPANYMDLNWEGVPAGWSAFATSATDSRLDELEAQYARAKDWCGQPLFLVYGGGKKVQAFCDANDCVHVVDARNAARKVSDGK